MKKHCHINLLALESVQILHQYSTPLITPIKSATFKSYISKKCLLTIFP